MSTAHSQRGFTLLESLVAIAILLIAVVGPMSIIGRSLPQSVYARDHAIAVNLAQEGIEAIRQKRDSNMLSRWSIGSPVWDNEIGDGFYFIDPQSATILSFCGVAPCSLDVRKIRQNSYGWYYQSSTGGAGLETKFQRTIEVQSSSAQEKQIIVTVLWADSMGGIHTLPVTEYISGINS